MAFIKRFAFNLGGKLKRYVFMLADDYKSVAKDTILGARQRPIKAAVILSGVGTIFYAVRTNAGYEDFSRQLTQQRLNLTMLSDRIRSPKADAHIQALTDLENSGRLRALNLILLTLVWRSDYGRNCQLFAGQCSALKPSWLTFYSERLLDVGVFGHWLFLERAMVDYDINPLEIYSQEKQFAF